MKTNSSGNAELQFRRALEPGWSDACRRRPPITAAIRPNSPRTFRSVAAPFALLLPPRPSLAVSPSPSSAGQDITLTATVSAADDSVPTGRRDLLRGWAEPWLNAFASGRQRARRGDAHDQPVDTRHLQITAQYAGDSTHSASASNTINEVVQPIVPPNVPPIVPPTAPPTVPPTVGPAVVSVAWVGNHSTSTTIVLQFDQALDPGPAQATSNYTILTTGMHGRFGKGSKRIALKSAVYNASSRDGHAPRFASAQRPPALPVDDQRRVAGRPDRSRRDLARGGAQRRPRQRIRHDPRRQNLVLGRPGPSGKARAHEGQWSKIPLGCPPCEPEEPSRSDFLSPRRRRFRATHGRP